MGLVSVCSYSTFIILRLAVRTFFLIEDIWLHLTGGGVFFKATSLRFQCFFFFFFFCGGGHLYPLGIITHSFFIKGGNQLQNFRELQSWLPPSVAGSKHRLFPNQLSQVCCAYIIIGKQTFVSSTYVFYNVYLQCVCVSFRYTGCELLKHYFPGCKENRGQLEGLMWDLQM